LNIAHDDKNNLSFANTSQPLSISLIDLNIAKRPKNQTISLYSPYYAETWNKFAGPISAS